MPDKASEDSAITQEIVLLGVSRFAPLTLEEEMSTLLSMTWCRDYVDRSRSEGQLDPKTRQGSWTSSLCALAATLFDQDSVGLRISITR